MSTTTTETPTPASGPGAAGSAPGAPALPAGSGPAAPAGPVEKRGRRRVRAWLTGTLGELRFVSERPVALLEHLAYARRGEWTEDDDGYRREAALVYAWLIAIPISTVVYLLAWVVARPARFATFVLFALLVGLAVSNLIEGLWTT